MSMSPDSFERVPEQILCLRDAGAIVQSVWQDRKFYLRSAANACFAAAIVC